MAMQQQRGEQEQAASTAGMHVNETLGAWCCRERSESRDLLPCVANQEWNIDISIYSGSMDDRWIIDD